MLPCDLQPSNEPRKLRKIYTYDFGGWEIYCTPSQNDKWLQLFRTESVSSLYMENMKYELYLRRIRILSGILQRITSLYGLRLILNRFKIRITVGLYFGLWNSCQVKKTRSRYSYCRGFPHQVLERMWMHLLMTGHMAFDRMLT